MAGDRPRSPHLAGRVSSELGVGRTRPPCPRLVNTPYFESYAADAADGSLYFFSRRPGGKAGSTLPERLQGGPTAEPVNLGSLNTNPTEWDPFVAPTRVTSSSALKKPGGSRPGRSLHLPQGKGRPVGPAGQHARRSSRPAREALLRHARREVLLFTRPATGPGTSSGSGPAYLDRFRKMNLL